MATEGELLERQQEASRRIAVLPKNDFLGGNGVRLGAGVLPHGATPAPFRRYGRLLFKEGIQLRGTVRGSFPCPHFRSRRGPVY